MTIAATVMHPDPHATEVRLDTPTSGHMYPINLANAAFAPPSPNVAWRRARFTYEWSNLTLLLMAGSHSYAAAINLTKHDGSGTYKHINKNAGEFEALAGRSIGVMEGFIHRQAGQNADGGWYHMMISGYYTVDTSDNPNAMGGDYWGFQGRVAFGGPDIKFGSFSGETGRASMHITYDWPTT